MPCNIYCLVPHHEQLEDLLATLKEAEVDPKNISVVSTRVGEVPGSTGDDEVTFAFPLSPWLAPGLFGVYPLYSPFFWPMTLAAWLHHRPDSHAWQTVGGRLIIPLKEYAPDEPVETPSSCRR